MEDSIKELFEVNADQIPSSIPLFPLDNVLLLPFGKLPLNIFEERYLKITKRLYGELDARLKESKFLAGNDYTIADIATWPWMARHEWHDIGLKNYKNLSRWYLEIADREAVVKGYSFMDRDAKIPKL